MLSFCRPRNRRRWSPRPACCGARPRRSAPGPRESSGSRSSPRPRSPGCTAARCPPSRRSNPRRGPHPRGTAGAQRGARRRDRPPPPRACDVLFSGSAIIASGQKAQSSAVRIGIFADRRPALDKTLHVIGDRKGAAAPEPFSRMPIVYERAFGGPGQDNPVGVESPNIVDPADPRRPRGSGQSRGSGARGRGSWRRSIARSSSGPWPNPRGHALGLLPGRPGQSASPLERRGVDRARRAAPGADPRADAAPVRAGAGPGARADGALADVPMAADMLVLAGDPCAPESCGAGRSSCRSPRPSSGSCGRRWRWSRRGAPLSSKAFSPPSRRREGRCRTQRRDFVPQRRPRAGRSSCMRLRSRCGCGCSRLRAAVRAGAQGR